MKDKFIYSLMVVVALVMGYQAIQDMSHPKEAEANRSSLSACTLEGDGNYNDYYTTTSLRYMTAGTATTTLSCSTGGVDQVDMLIAFRASSTNSTLGWWYEFSRNGVDWYAAQSEFDIGSASSSISLVRNYSKYVWSYASTSAEENQGKADTAFARISVKDIAAPYMRVRFFMPVGSLNGGFQVEGLKKIQKL
jgi:hypothetical protein